MALHGKLEYFTDILKTLLNDLVEQYVAKNPKLMLRRYETTDESCGVKVVFFNSLQCKKLVFFFFCRTETVVEKLLTNWMSICLYAFLRVSQLLNCMLFNYWSDSNIFL